MLVNDWSARDVQRVEYEPLGPFIGKSFQTSISAWVTPLDALGGARVAPRAQDPAPAPYLRAGDPWVLDVDLEIELDGEVVSRPPARELYWTPAQMLAHLTVNGATLNAGDLVASGTISGAAPAARARSPSCGAASAGWATARRSCCAGAPGRSSSARSAVASSPDFACARSSDGPRLRRVN